VILVDHCPAAKKSEWQLKPALNASHADNDAKKRHSPVLLRCRLWVINSRKAGLSPCPLLDKGSGLSIAPAEFAAGFLGSFGRNGHPCVDGGQCQLQTKRKDSSSVMSPSSDTDYRLRGIH
jgi:hypothetical protein